MAKTKTETTDRVGKPFKFQMTGQDGNAFFILGRFVRDARRCGWTEDQIKTVCDEAESGDYDNLLQTFMKYTDAR